MRLEQGFPLLCSKSWDNIFLIGWESQLLETGFLAIFFCPVFNLSAVPKSSPSLVVIYAYRWLIFRIMLGAVSSVHLSLPILYINFQYSLFPIFSQCKEIKFCWTATHPITCPSVYY